MLQRPEGSRIREAYDGLSARASSTTSVSDICSVCMSERSHRTSVARPAASTKKCPVGWVASLGPTFGYWQDAETARPRAT